MFLLVRISKTIGYSLLMLSFLWLASCESGNTTVDSVRLDKEAANALVKMLRENKIHRMDDGSKYVRYLNGISIRMQDSIGAGRNDRTVYYKTALQQLNITEPTFEQLSSQLKNTQLKKYEYHAPYHLFLVGGMVNKIWGYIYTEEPLSVGAEAFYVGGYTVKVEEDMGDGWYRFTGVT